MNASSDTFCPRCGGHLAETYVEAEERNRLVCRTCGHVHYLNPKIVAGTIPVEADRIWLLRRGIEPRYGFWTFPAGFMELGETVEEGALRETREELGMQVEIRRLVGVYSLPHITTVHIIYEAVARTPPTGGAETLEYSLVPFDAIPWDNLAFATTRMALQDFLRLHS